VLVAIRLVQRATQDRFSSVSLGYGHKPKLRMSHILVQQWKTAKETFVMSEAKMSVGLKFRNRVY